MESAKSSGEAVRRESYRHLFTGNPSRRIALLFVARRCDAKVSLLAGYHLTCHATVHQHMKTANAFHHVKDSRNFCRTSNGKVHLILVSYDRNIRDHLWRWSTLYRLDRSDWNLPFRFLTNCLTALLLFTYVGDSEKEQEMVRVRFPLVGPVWTVSSGIEIMEAPRM